MTTVAVGQIWRKVDPRQERFILVLDVRDYTVAVRTVVRSEAVWVAAKGSRTSYLLLKRFSGKPGGYEFVEIAVAAGAATGEIDA